METDNQSDRKYILSIDQGTTSTRVAIIDNTLTILALEQIEHQQIHTSPGWTEHDPIQLFMNIQLLIDRHYHNNKEVK